MTNANQMHARLTVTTGSGDIEWETVLLLDGTRYGVAGTLPDGSGCLWTVEDGHWTLDESSSDKYTPTDDYEWPAPPDEMCDEALRLTEEE